MLQTFIIILREGFESFLLVAVVLAYLRKTNQNWLAAAVYWAIAVSIAISVALGYVLKNGINEEYLHRIFGDSLGSSINFFFNNESWREGVLGVVAILMVASLVIYMWRTGPRLKMRMEQRLSKASSKTSRVLAFASVFLFTALMITREGMETALLLLQVRDSNIVSGALLGLVAVGLLAWAWARFGHLINMKRFFQVTGIFLLLFMVQVAIYSFHEFSEAGLFPNSDAIHEATESFSPDGIYGRWFSLVMIAACALWLVGAWVADRLKTAKQSPAQLEQGQA